MVNGATTISRLDVLRIPMTILVLMIFVIAGVRITKNVID